MNHKTLLGASRPIRGDEYVVNTMFAFSQYMNDFAYFTDIVRAATTDMFIIYGQPVFDIGMIFRPFLIGYLFLNQGQGLSFFWIARLVFLFLVSFELGMLLTNKNKTFSCAYAFLITFAPVVQWWFAINGLVEQLIFGQLGVLLIKWYMNADDYKKRLLIAIGLMICVGTFILVFYPSWQIPFGYVFVLLAIWIFLKNWHNFTYSTKDFMIFGLVLIIFSVIMAHILNNSLETINIIMNTSYPGSEVFNGGGSQNLFTYYIPTIFYSLKQDGLLFGSNVCNYSVFFDLFPLPLVLSAIVLLKQKTKDKLLIGILALYFIFVIFYLVQLPDFIVHVTLRGHMKSSRLPPVITFIGVLMLIRSISSLKEIKNKETVIISSIALSILMVAWTMTEFNEYYLSWMPIIAFIILVALSFVSLRSSSEKYQKIFLVSIICVTLLCGGLVNPIDTGTDVIFESDYFKHVEDIVKNDPNGIWIVNEGGHKYNNIPIAAGARTINSVNTYPDLEKWQKIDPNNESYDIYNRYAHIMVNIVDNDNADTNFTLIKPDLFQLNLNINDLNKLNVSYIQSPHNLDAHSNDKVHFTKIYEYGEHKIFKVDYP
ncbi:MAG: hypothetical protein U0L42_09350 [Methanobrevibacter sp.]|nr:hypothetical protein [Methanobrevibacter sp.]MEE0935866.1 hypothetical protein [Methanobrevibacter sp.]